VTEQAAKFDPSYVTMESPTAEHGAPVIDPNGNVLGGNSRTMALGRVYGSNPEAAEAYKATLRDRAASLGMKPEDVDWFQKPVLVRETTGALDAQRAITDFNKTVRRAARGDLPAAGRVGRAAVTGASGHVIRCGDGGFDGQGASAALTGGQMNDAMENGSLEISSPQTLDLLSHVWRRAEAFGIPLESALRQAFSMYLGAHGAPKPSLGG
jgi:ddrB-like ParB superfamily domain